MDSDGDVGAKPNWSAVSRTDRTVFQRQDIDHYVVLGDGSEEWLIILCAQRDRAYPALLDSPKSGKRAGLFRGDHDRWSIL